MPNQTSYNPLPQRGLIRVLPQPQQSGPLLEATGRLITISSTTVPLTRPTPLPCLSIPLAKRRSRLLAASHYLSAMNLRSCYSPNLVEGEFSEVHLQDLARRSHCSQ